MYTLLTLVLKNEDGTHSIVRQTSHSVGEYLHCNEHYCKNALIFDRLIQAKQRVIVFKSVTLTLNK